MTEVISPVIAPTLSQQVIDRPHDAARLLRSLGDEGAALQFEQLMGREVVKGIEATGAERSLYKSLMRQLPPYAWSDHAFGYIKPDNGSDELLPLQDARRVAPDKTLLGARIKITLDRLYVADYPGDGKHNVLFQTDAKNQAGPVSEQLHFAQTFSVGEGEGAGITGYPIFVGLSVGTEGVDFGFRTVNVFNDRDRAVLALLDSSPFKSGLKLLKKAQPAITPLADLALGFTTMFLSRNENVKVHEVSMGLDLSSIALRPRLAEGSYVVVQVPDQSDWPWDHWVFDPRNVRIRNAQESIGWLGLNYNHFIFSVSRYEGE